MSNPPRPLAAATATISLGTPGLHSTTSLLKATAAAGLEGIEICYGNLHHHALSLAGLDSDAEPQPDQLIAAAKDIRQQCSSLNLTIIALQPFAGYDGLTEASEHESKIEKFKLWLEIAAVLETDIIQVPTNFSASQTTGDITKLTADMREIAELAAQRTPVIHLAYEAMAWGTHTDRWEGTWEIVEAVNLPNLGLCLDTFHIAARVFADPEVQNGISPTGKQDLIQSLLALVKDIPVEKIFYLQLSDAEFLSHPLIEGHEYHHPDRPARMSWSRNARLFPCEEALGGFLPVLSIAKAVVNEMGYRGWISMEVFSRHLAEGGEGVPVEFARRAARSWGKVRDKLGWDGLT